MTAIRIETDSFGPLEVPADKYWGARTRMMVSAYATRLRLTLAADQGGWPPIMAAN